MEVGRYKSRIGAIIQARMGSSRLPNKINKLLPVTGDKTVLDHIINSIKQIKEIDFICIATSIHTQNDFIENKYGCFSDITVFRGSENDVLSRFGIVNRENNLSHIIRLTADNPVVDITILKDLISFHIDNDYDHSSTNLLPLGANFSIFKSEVLDLAFDNAVLSYDREHVEPWIKNNSSFRKGILNYNNFLEYKNLRLTIDYPSDYAFMNLLFGLLDEISLSNITEVLSKNTWLLQINNQSNYQKKQLKSEKEELIEAIKILKNIELDKAANILLDYEKNTL